MSHSTVPSVEQLISGACSLGPLNIFCSCFYISIYVIFNTLSFVVLDFCLKILFQKFGNILYIYIYIYIYIYRTVVHNYIKKSQPVKEWRFSIHFGQHIYTTLDFFSLTLRNISNATQKGSFDTDTGTISCAVGASGGVMVSKLD